MDIFYLELIYNEVKIKLLKALYKNPINKKRLLLKYYNRHK